MVSKPEEEKYAASKTDVKVPTSRNKIGREKGKKWWRYATTK
jgi:hypothetical protein